MSDSIVIDGDTVVFDALFTPAQVVVQPGTIHGTGAATVDNKKVCVQGDEAKVQVMNCNYTSGAFVGGMGTLSIQSLDPLQIAKVCTTSSTPVILKGAKFIAQFQVTNPGKNPSGATDPVALYVGTGEFQSANQDKSKGT